MTTDVHAGDHTSAQADRTAEAGWGRMAVFLRFTLPGILFGALAWLIVDRIEDGTTDRLLVAAFAFVTILPVAYWFTTSPVTRLSSALYAAVLAVVLANLYLLAAFSYGWFEPDQGSVGVAWGLCALAIAAITQPFFRARMDRGQPFGHYPSLFEFAWNAPVISVLASIFTGIFWAVLALWAALFAVIGIEFFNEIFYEGWFAWPATYAAFATAVGIIRGQESVILAVRGIVLALLHVLGPIVMVASVLFVASLPFTGLAPLFETDSPTALMLWVVIVAVILINAVLGDGVGGSAARTGILTISARIQGVILVVLMGVAAYGILVRIGQYGLTVPRFYAAVLVSIAGLYALGYAVASLLPSWQRLVQRINIALALIVALIALVVLTPLVNPYALTADNQLQRLESGRVSVAEFDYGYLQYELGASGKQALERIRTDETLPDREVIDAQLAALAQTEHHYQWRQLQRDDTGRLLDPEEFLGRYMEVLPSGQTVPIDLKNLLVGDESIAGLSNNCTEDGETCILVMDGTNTLLVIISPPSMRTMQFRALDDGAYQATGFTWNRIETFADDGDALIAALRNGRVDFTPVTIIVPSINETVVLPVNVSDQWLDAQDGVLDGEVLSDAARIREAAESGADEEPVFPADDVTDAAASPSDAVADADTSVDVTDADAEPVDAGDGAPAPTDAPTGEDDATSPPDEG